MSFPTSIFCANMLKYSDTVSRPSGLAASQLNAGHVGAAMTAVEAPSNDTNNVEACILIDLGEGKYEEEGEKFVGSNVNWMLRGCGFFVEVRSSLYRYLP